MEAQTSNLDGVSGGTEKTNVRLIARMDIKGTNLIKGINLEGLRVIGDPKQFASKYYAEGADEIVCIDIVASLYGRNNLLEIVSRMAEDVFIPITVGGGVRSVEDVRKFLRHGADKVAINTMATQRPELISEVARTFGSQCMVLSIEAKKTGEGTWEVLTENGRERTGLDVVQWAKRGVELGAGEILLTSIDQEGTRRGFDLALVRAVSDAVSVPVIASGGFGSPPDFIKAVSEGHADAVAIADALHYNRHSIQDVRTFARRGGIPMRHFSA